MGGRVTKCKLWRLGGQFKGPKEDSQQKTFLESSDKGGGKVANVNISIGEKSGHLFLEFLSVHNNLVLFARGGVVVGFPSDFHFL
jgi:hypothetical protein